MVSFAQARAVIAGLKNLKANGVTADWIDPKIAEYEVLLTRAYLIDGRPEPTFEPYRNSYGELVINEEGDTDQDV